MKRLKLFLAFIFILLSCYSFGQAQIQLFMDGTYIDSNNNNIANPGDVVQYTFTLINSGTENFNSISLISSDGTITGSLSSLPIGTTNSTTFTAVYVITQSDINAGYVYAYGIVSATTTLLSAIQAISSDPTPCISCPLLPNCISCTITQIPQMPSIHVTMDGYYVDTNGDGVNSVGDKVVYDFVVANTGNVTITNVMVSCSNSDTFSVPSFLQVGASLALEFHSEHIITAADLINGQVDNLATVTGISPIGSTVTYQSNDPTPCTTCVPLSASCTTCTIVTFVLNLSVNNSYTDTNSNGIIDVGDVLNYTYALRNYSTTIPVTAITLSCNNVSISGGPLTLPPLTTNNSTFNGIHVITQSDINNGVYTTTTTAQGNYDGGSILARGATTYSLANNGIKMNVFIDSNGNGIQDSGEVNLDFGNFTYQMNGGSVTNIYTSNGMHTIYESNPATAYSLGYTLPTYMPNYSVSPSSYPNVTVPNGSGITTYNFALTLIPYTDLAVRIISLNQIVPGFSHFNRVLIKNNGNQTISSGTATYNKDNALTISSISPGATPTANGFTYDFTNLLPQQVISIDVVMQVPTIPTVSLGQLITNSASITIPAGDALLQNNSHTLAQYIVGAFDPNDKSESHGGRIQHSTFSSNDYLMYTILFENTGTANALNVKVDDVLNSKLDESSIVMVASSHNYILSRVGSTLSWKFNNINLPPSNGSTTIGHGYITFQIKPKTGYAIGDIIPNTANIYFDFNPAITTPVCNTEFVAALNTNNYAFTEFKYYPNPIKNSLFISNNSEIDAVEITSVLGQKMMHKEINALQVEVDLSGFSNGIYFVKITSEGQEKIIKIIKQ